jgi:hypothetical protein
VHELDTRRIQPGGISQLRERNEGSRDLGRDIDALRRIDSYRQAVDEPVELTLRQRAKDVSEPVGGFGDA